MANTLQFGCLTLSGLLFLGCGEQPSAGGDGAAVVTELDGDGYSADVDCDDAECAEEYGA